MTEDRPTQTYELPRLPVSSGAMIWDGEDRLLIVRPTYKSGWSLPGGVMQDDGETPWQACQREVREETGLLVVAGRLAAVDCRPARPDRSLALRYLFDCGRLPAGDLARIRLQADEISEHRFAALDEALRLLRRPIRRRVAAATASEHCVYLEDGAQPADVH